MNESQVVYMRERNEEAAREVTAVFFSALNTPSTDVAEVIMKATRRPSLRK